MMRRVWMRIRMPLAVIAILVIALAMARIFSGPEDTWIKNEHGEWVRHGHPSGPPPAQDYQEPFTHLAVPVAFLVAFAVPLFFISRHKPRNRLNFDTATRDIKLYGYLSTSLFLFGVLVAAGLILELALGGNSGNAGAQADSEALLFIGALLGFAGLCIVLSIQFFLLKRNINDLPEVIKLGKSIKAKYFSVSNLQPATADMRSEQLYNQTLNNVAYLDAINLPRLSLPKMDFDEDTREAEEKHRPQAIPLDDGNHCSVEEHRHFLHQRPPLICVQAREEEAPLQHHKEHIEESDKMAGR